jgi:hypothetical protein
MIITMIKITKFIFATIALTAIIFSCSDTKAVESPPRPNCGKIVRIYYQNETKAEGNPCADQASGGRGFAFIVKNDITGNERVFCNNDSVIGRYKLGSVYCDSGTTDGW